MGIYRFGKFHSTYNDNGAPEKSGRIDHLVSALQTYGMSFRDTAELYRTPDGDYVVEDTDGRVAATVQNAREWRRENRRMYARVKNAKAKPVERFFRTLETLLQDMVLPGYVRDLRSTAAEDEEAERRLDWQKKQGYILQYEEFAEKVKEAVVRYENRDHAGLGRSPLEELRYAREREGWEPNRIDENDIRHIFLESARRTVKGNRIQIAGINYVGPQLTREMLKENRNNLAGLSGRRIEVFYDPDDLDAGAWAMDPRDGVPVYLRPEDRINPFNAADLSREIEAKRRAVKAVTGAYREAAAIAGTVLTSPEYKPRIEAQAMAEKTPALKDPMSDEDFDAAVAVANRLVREQGEKTRRQAVYANPTKRYQSILDAIIRGDDLSAPDRLFKAGYEKRMGDGEKERWATYITFNQGG